MGVVPLMRQPPSIAMRAGAAVSAGGVAVGLPTLCVPTGDPSAWRLLSTVLLGTIALHLSMSMFCSRIGDPLRQAVHSLLAVVVAGLLAVPLSSIVVLANAPFAYASAWAGIPALSNLLLTVLCLGAFALCVAVVSKLECQGVVSWLVRGQALSAAVMYAAMTALLLVPGIVVGAGTPEYLESTALVLICFPLGLVCSTATMKCLK